MKYTCEKCGHHGNTKTVKPGDVDINALYAEFGLEQELVREYIALFAPACGVIYQKREARLVKDVLTIWQDGLFVRDGIKYEVTQARLTEALEIVVGRLTHTKTHGYLLEILKTWATTKPKPSARGTMTTGKLNRTVDAAKRFVEGK